LRTLPLYGEDGIGALVESTEPLALDANCGRCALGKRAVTRCMSAALVGDLGPTLYVVGYGPTQQEDRTGMPFSGSTGTYVRQLISRH